MKLNQAKRGYSGGIAQTEEESTARGFHQELMAADARTALDEW